MGLVKDNQLVVVKLGATWCGPCCKLDPVIEEMAQKYPDVVYIVLDKDDFEFPFAGVEGIPDVRFIMNGVEKN